MELILKEECFAVVGACMEVYNQPGAGFLEPVCQEALQLELGDRNWNGSGWCSDSSARSSWRSALFV